MGEITGLLGDRPGPASEVAETESPGAGEEIRIGRATLWASGASSGILHAPGSCKDTWTLAFLGRPERQSAGELARMLAQRGEAALGEFDGAFAFAYANPGQGLYVAARDVFGAQAVFYAEAKGGTAFSTSLVRLVKTLGRVPEADPVALDRYLTYLYMPAPHTGLQGVRALRPGEALVCARRRRRLLRLPKLRTGPELQIALDEAASELEEALVGRLDELSGDEEACVLLSGGTDSSLTAALLARSGRKITALTAGFDEPEYDERAGAGRIARKLGIRHSEVCVGPPRLDDLFELARLTDGPLGDSSLFALRRLALEAGRRARLVFTGDGGDEFFGGYERYAGLRVARLARVLPFLGRLAGGRREPGRGTLSRALRWLARAASLPPGRAYPLMRVAIPRHVRDVLFTGGAREEVMRPDDGEEVAELIAESGARGKVAALGYADAMMYLADDGLAKTRAALRGTGLEAASPFLARSAAEFGLRLPDSLKVPGLPGLLRRLFSGKGPGTKRLVRHLAGGLLGEAAPRGRKRGFGVPLRKWLAGPLGRELRGLILDGRFVENGVLSAGGLERLLDGELDCGVQFSLGERIWALAMLEAWWKNLREPA